MKIIHKIIKDVWDDDDFLIYLAVITSIMFIFW